MRRIWYEFIRSSISVSCLPLFFVCVTFGYHCLMLLNTSIQSRFRRETVTDRNETEAGKLIRPHMSSLTRDPSHRCTGLGTPCPSHRCELCLASCRRKIEAVIGIISDLLSPNSHTSRCVDVIYATCCSAFAFSAAFNKNWLNAWLKSNTSSIGSQRR